MKLSRHPSGPPRGRAPSIPLALCALVALLAAADAGASFERDGRFFTAAPAETLSRAQAQRAWTPQRLANAAPLVLGADGELRLARTTSESTPAARAPREDAIGARRYPNRVHGKLVGRFPGLGDFSCSATIVSSESGSLLTSAGHCAYDPGRRVTASELAFAPGYSRGRLPYGVWPVRNLIVPGAWARFGSLDFDLSMLRTVERESGPVQGLGSRGIGFGQPQRLRLQAYGYPAAGRPGYDGRRLIRCASRSFPDPARFGGPRGRGMRCDQGQGSSGGGWVAQRSFVVSNTSHGYPRRDGFFFGPSYDATARAMYASRVRGWPSIGPIRCGGKVATIVGTERRDRIRGTRGRDVIATIGGPDVVSGRGGDDLICGAEGDDVIEGAGGRDRIDGGPGTDRCGARRGNRLRACEGGGS